MVRAQLAFAFAGQPTSSGFFSSSSQSTTPSVHVKSNIPPSPAWSTVSWAGTAGRSRWGMPRAVMGAFRTGTKHHA